MPFTSFPLSKTKFSDLVSDNIRDHLLGEQTISVANDFSVVGSLTADSISATTWNLSTSDVPAVAGAEYITWYQQIIYGDKLFQNSVSLLNGDSDPLKIYGYGDDVLKIGYDNTDAVFTLTPHPGFDLRCAGVFDVRDTTGTGGILKVSRDTAEVGNDDVVGCLQFVGRDYNVDRIGAQIRASAVGGWSNATPKAFKANSELSFIIEDQTEFENTLSSMDITAGYINARVPLDCKNGLKINGTSMFRTADELNLALNPNDHNIHSGDFSTTGKLRVLGPMTRRVWDVTEDYSMNNGDFLVVMNSETPTTIILPNISTMTQDSYQFILKNRSTGTCTVAPNGPTEKFLGKSGSVLGSIDLLHGNSLHLIYHPGSLYFLVI